MRYLTDRKRAERKGASGTGTEHHWYMSVSAVALAFLIPTFLYVFGHALGQGRAEVVATFGHPFGAILTGLVLFVSMQHFAKGAQMMIEDYTQGSWRRGLVMLVYSLAYVITATGLYALVKMAM
ncbi:succinate dehydrogenase [Defluviimonas sp. 20V17]|uniref:Succinate dehydrogenase hydrophobic membrane anchor subunit n=1 Tax=Allgaiera indica TaxID=765699 RepID=A0AAN4UQX0_9RHOB|nr:succinate dehydrogenase, hydrophobic membrane anchor protein [Allgaiera indica]KDB02598.1 succinate dehydrogenase [Defluviimonas sp. 20V17]GHE01690.1 succinate dehydrogenase [Allgaiera indica]SDW95876.1 succinate dehydrogenase subunit D [Allgaiera indica]